MTIYEGRNQVTSPFGQRIHPIYGTKSQHNGLDVVGLDDKRQRFVNKHNKEGIVNSIGFDRYRGNYVLVDLIGDPRGKVDVRYQHISAAQVSKGQRIKVGDIVATEGSTGDSTGSHCHYEVRVNGVPLNPSEDCGLPNKVGVYQGTNDVDTGSTESKGEEDMKQFKVLRKVDKTPSSKLVDEGNILVMDANGSLNVHMPPASVVARKYDETDPDSLSTVYENIVKEMQPGDVLISVDV